MDLTEDPLSPVSPAAQAHQSLISRLSNLLFNPQSEALTIPVSKFSLFLIAFGIFLYVLDIVSDVLLAVKFYYSEKSEGIKYFWLTLSFVVISNLTVTTVNIIMYLTKPNNETPIEDLGYLARCRKALPYLGLYLGPVPIEVLAFKNGLKTRNVEDLERIETHKKAMNKAATESAILKLFEAFMESAPQATLQICILLVDFNNEDFQQRFWQLITLGISFLSCAWSVSSFNRRMIAELEVSNVPYIGSVIFCLGNACIVIARSFAAALFASVYPPSIVIILFVFNWCTMFGWVSFGRHSNFRETETTDEEHVCVGYTQFGLACMFCFMFYNIFEKGRASWKSFSRYYVTALVLNTVLLIAWSYSFQWANSPDWLWKLGLDYALFFFGIIFLVFYKIKYETKYMFAPAANQLSDQQST